jgi:hypothetical protein
MLLHTSRAPEMALPLFATSTSSTRLYMGNHQLHSNAHTSQSHAMYKQSISGYIGANWMLQVPPRTTRRAYTTVLCAMRSICWNHVEFALHGRLQSLKQAVGPFSDEATKMRIKTAKNAGSSRSTITSNLMTIAPTSLPPTPSSNYSGCEPDKREKKRQRVEDNGLNG